MGFESDSLFSALPAEIQRLIDKAFDSIFLPNQSNATSSSSDGPVGGGGFINEGGFVGGDGFIGGGGFIVEPEFVESSSSANDYRGGGGFIVELDSTSASSNPTDQIPLDRVPSALQRLDLPPDDDQILSVFKNAASGWQSDTLKPAMDLDPSKEYVSRADWRSVCAVLLDTQSSDAGSDDDKPVWPRGADRVNDVEMVNTGLEDDDDAGSSDEYAEEDLSPLSDVSGEESSEEEYQATSSRKRTRGSTATKSTGRSTRRRRGASPSLVDPQQMTRRQRQTCIDTYALFFPDFEGEELMKQKIMLKDIQRIAKVLGEKLKAEEVCIHFHDSLATFGAHTHFGLVRRWLRW